MHKLKLKLPFSFPSCSLRFLTHVCIYMCVCAHHFSEKTIINVYVPVARARGGSEVALGLYWPFSSVELACAVRQPGPCARALCEPVALLLSKNMTCARPRCNATPSEHFLHTSRCTLHSPHFILHTCTSHSTLHLISNHVSSSHLISPHLSSSHLFPSLLTQQSVRRCTSNLLQWSL